MSEIETPQVEFQRATASQVKLYLGSIGCFVKQNKIDVVKERDRIIAYRFNANVRNTLYSQTSAVIAKQNNLPVFKLPKMSDNCIFRDDPVFAESTGFLVYANGNRDVVVATAGHCVFDDKKPNTKVCDVAEEFAGGYFIFGLNEDLLDNIPIGNVWGIERVLFGQNERFQDMTVFQNSKPALNSLTEIDRPDWALVRLKNLGTSQLPGENLPAQGALPLLSSAGLTDKDPGVWLAGYPWGTSLKISYPSKTSPSKAVIRTKVLSAERPDFEAELQHKVQSHQGGDYEFVNIIRHNARATTGNSGSPVWLNDRVVGIHASGSGEELNVQLFEWKKKGDPLRGSIEPYFPPNKIQYNLNATKNSLWLSLMSNESELLVVVGLEDRNAPIGTQGMIKITMEAYINKTEPTTFTAWKGKNSPKMATVALAKLPPGIPPYNIRKVEISYEPPVKGRQIVMFERFQLVCRKTGEENHNYWTALHQHDLDKPPHSMTRSTEHDEVVHPEVIDIGPYIDKSWRDNLVMGPNNLLQLGPPVKSLE